MVDVIPGILEKDIADIEHAVGLVASHVRGVQIDFADNTLVANTTYLDPAGFAKLISAHPHLSFEAHLMVASPEKYIRGLADAGFKRLIAHIEANDPRVFLDEAQLESAEVGLAIDGPTEIEQIEPFLEEIDVALVMTIEAGFSGQSFMPETMEKVRAIRKNFIDLAIEVDGGINADTARVARDAGATRLVSTSFLFKDPENIGKAIEQLKNG
jgi:ribulose-phosphate 3-epimerase